MIVSRIPGFALCFVLAIGIGAAAGRTEDERIWRVGVLFWHASPNDERAWRGVEAGFRLAELAIEPEVRNVEEDADAGRELLQRWEKEGFDLVYALGTEAALLARDAIQEVPVVFTAVTNPFGSGVVDSWEGSGRNIAGNSNWIPPADVLEVFQAASPGLARLGVILNPRNRVSLEEVAEARRWFQAAPEKAVKLIEEGISGPTELTEAAERAMERGAQAIWIPIDYDVYRNLERVSAATMPRGIPLLSSQRSAVETDAIVGVAVDYEALGRNSVVLAKKILVDGADPGSLPVGRLRSFQTIVNLTAARRTGVELPLPLLATADRILDPAAGVR